MKIVIRVKFFAIVITIMLLMALAMSVVSAGAPAKVKVNLSEQHKEKINQSEPYKEEVNQSEEHEIVINLSETITIPTSRSSWSIETVDSAGYGHGHTSLALDSNGYPHISYYCWSWGYLKYAKWAGSEWEIETMDSTRDADYYSSLALDSNDYPHISYYDRYNENLKYAKWTGSVWDIEIVDLTRYVGMYTSLALDTSDCPHISYFHDIHGELMYAKWTGSAWDIETVDSAGYVGEYTSIALDSNGYPHISYYDYINKSLKYAKWTGSTWEIETVDLDGYTGRYTSIALDTNDYPHISYYGNSALKYARWTGSLWSIETLDLDARKDITSIALDTNDYPHISYYCSSPTPYADLKYAKWTGSIWSLQVVDSLGDVGSGSSLALDTTDCPHISYYDRSYDALKYAYYLSDIVTLLNITQAQTDKSTYALSETVTISCIAQNETGYNITADSVNAEILKPDSSIEWATMTEGLVGHYNGTFTNTSLNGTYNVTIYANKTGYVNDTAELWFEVSKMIYVDASNIGDPLEDGTIYHPFDKIQEGIDAAGSGDTVLVADGIYTGYRNKNLFWDGNIKHIIVRSENGANSCIIDCEGEGRGFALVDTYQNNSDVINGFAIKNGNPSADGGGIYCKNSAPIICNNIFIGNYGHGGGGAIQIRNYNLDTEVQIVGNLIYNNTVLFDGAAMRLTVCNANVISNTIYGNKVDFRRTGGIEIDNAYNPGKVVRITNNIIWNNDKQQINNQHGVTQLYVTYCDVHGGWSGTGNIDTDPLFVGGDPFDYHLQAGSPCIDAGNNTGAPSTDFDGNPRPIDGDEDGIAIVDMGAFEYVPPDHDELYITQAQTDKSTYALNENVTISCIAQNETGYNITADSVDAEILKSDRSIEWVTMTEGLAGHYNGTFTNTSLNGTYNVTIYANKTGYVNDTAELSFEVANITGGLFIDSNQDFGSGSLAVAVGDIDNDGDLDVIFGDGGNKVYRNSGDGIFSYDYTFGISGDSGAGSTKSLKLGDFDGDGDLDLIEGILGYNAHAHAPAEVIIYENGGEGNFTYVKHLIHMQPSSYWDVSQFMELGDIDNDTDLDIVICLTFSNSVEIYLNDGGDFVKSHVMSSPFPKGGALGDIDNDGDLDLVTSNSEGVGNKVFKNNGSGYFIDTGQSLGSSYTYSVALADIDNDGDLDLAAANINTQNKIYLNDGTGNFTFFYAFGTARGYSHPVVFGDIDCDNDIDMITGGDTIYIYLNNGRGQFIGSIQNLTGTGSLTGDVALEDIDDDGDLDLITAGWKNKLYINTGERTLLNITQAQTDKSTYAFTETVTISCTVQNETGHNITADSVNADILKPDRSIEWVTMTEGLVGHYNGTFTNTSLNGTYNVMIYANKTGYVNDTAELSFEVSTLPVHNLDTGENFSSIQAAIDDSDTLDGHTIRVDAGTYNENVDVNKRLTIRSENGADVTVVQAVTHGYVIEVTASFVTISGFTVTGATGACGGIWLHQVDHCNICDNKVLHNDAEGIGVSSSCNNTLSGNDCFYNSVGIVLSFSNSNTLSGNDCSDNHYGISIMSSNDNELKSNTVNSNHREGIHMVDSNNNVITKATASNNNWAIRMDDTSICSNNLIYLNNFINNANNIFISSGSTNIWNSPLEITYTYDGTAYTNYLGNYWDDYEGTDADGDGIGDTSYTINSENDNYPLMVGFENYTLKPPTPSFTSHAPESPVNDYVGVKRTFSITINQTVDVSWQINGTEVQTNASVTEASYTNTSAVNGTWNVSAIVTNANGTDMQTWDWTVTSPCFIATAAYGTPLHGDINVLRDFRDDYLMPNPAGRAFVKIYYDVSPPLANAIRDNGGLRTAVREGIVKPVVYITRRFVE